MNKRVHFIGIGGIGMSGIAHIMQAKGFVVSGCDTDIKQKTAQALQTQGCAIYQGNNSPECLNPVPDIIVYSSAIQRNNPEIISAQKLGILVLHRAEILALLIKNATSIAVTGSHGKTTTSGMIAHVLMHAGVDPTIIIGGILRSINTNARTGQSDVWVIEADESDRSCTRLYPTYGLITNIDREHFETYTDLADIKNTYQAFTHTVSDAGSITLCIDDQETASLIPTIPASKKIITYGFSTNARIQGSNLVLHAYGSYFHVQDSLTQTEYGTVFIPMAGRHNALNALGCISIALQHNIPFSCIQKGLRTYPGVERRFVYNGQYQGASVWNDYGHHPNEILHTLTVASMHATKGLLVVFQPHRFIRTEKLWDDFIAVFAHSTIRHLIITDIYPAGELPIPGIDSARLVAAIRSKNPESNVVYKPYTKDHQAIKAAIDQQRDTCDTILLLGAGTVDTIAKTLVPPTL